MIRLPFRHPCLLFRARKAHSEREAASMKREMKTKYLPPWRSLFHDHTM
jgi:hypothetical protein